MRPWIAPALSMMSGASLAIIPAATLAIASRLFDEPTQGMVAVGVSVATFAGQLAGGAIVEARLSAVGRSRSVAVPWWLVAGAALAALAVVVSVDSAVVLVVSLPILAASLEVGRAVGVAEHRDRRELWAGAVVGVGALTAVLAAFADQRWALLPLVAGIVGALATRVVGAPREVAPIVPRTAAWVVADVGITGVIYPVLNSLILVSLGPASAVVFTAVSTVSGLLAVPLNFLRLRLLKSHSIGDIALAGIAIVIAASALVVADLTGLLSFVFGAAWQGQATLIPLIVASAWRIGSLGATLPFAALRRAGRVALLTVLRCAAAVLTLAAAAAVLPLDSVALVFCALLAGEFLQFALYETARRRHRPITPR